jgi:hypothetical protein
MVSCHPGRERGICTMRNTDSSHAFDGSEGQVTTYFKLCLSTSTQYGNTISPQQ